MDHLLSENTRFLIVMTIVPVAIGLEFWRRRRAVGNLAELAREQGLEVKSQPRILGIFPKLPQAEGRHQGRAVRFYSYNKTYGQHHQAYSAVAARYGGKDDFVLLVDARPNVWRLFKGPRLERALTGEMDFDQSFPAKTNDPTLAKSILNLETRAQITAARRQRFGLSGRLKVEKGEATYAVCGGFNNRERMGYLVGQLALVCGIARQIEKAK